MTGTDPAVDAARRAFDRWRSARPPKSAEVIAETAAREALAPIRARHQPQAACVNILHEWVECGGCETRCRHCGDQWPCDDARDSWTSEELNHDQH